MLLATLNLDKKRFKFDTSKLTMTLPEATRSSIKRSLNEGRLLFSEHDMYIDLREPLLPRDLTSLIYRLIPLNSIVGVRLHRIFMVDYSYSVIASKLRWPTLPLVSTLLLWDSGINLKHTIPKLLPQVHITVALAIAGLW